MTGVVDAPAAPVAEQTDEVLDELAARNPVTALGELVHGRPDAVLRRLHGSTDIAGL